MIESPIVNTCVGAAAALGAAAVTEEEVGLGVAEFLAAGAGVAPEVEDPDGVALGLVDAVSPEVVDRAAAVEVNTTAVRSELMTTTTVTTIALARGRLRGDDTDIGLQLFGPANGSRPAS
jgi:hypothetical protein